MSLDFIVQLFPKLIEGTWITILLLIITGILGNAGAVGVALARVSKNPAIRLPAQGYITLMRGTPLLLQIYLLYYGLGDIFAHTSFIRYGFLWPFFRDGFWYAVAALSLNTAAYSGEVLRGAIEAVPHGEIEAGVACGMSRFLLLRRIILPRAFRIALPTFSGETILLLKATALASTVTVMDMMGMANFIRAQSFRVYEPLLAAAFIYIVLTFILTRGFVFLERHLNKDRVAPKQVLITVRPGA
jgi:His/Glu/Gln/Arg/opine family amino acid ABC transporter permease subunit